METKHTATPWLCQSPDDDGTIFIVGSNLGGLVGAALCWPIEVEEGGSDRVRANAALIVRAVNCHDELVAMLNRAADFVQPFNRAHDFLDEIEALIAKAKPLATDDTSCNKPTGEAITEKDLPY